MAKILCITSGLTGILNASFELVHQLERAGHEVIYASPKNVAQQVEAQNIPFHALPAIDTQPGPPLPEFEGRFKKGARLWFKIKNKQQRKQQALQNTNPHAFSILLEEQSPDLLLVDIELHEYIFKAYNKKAPMLLLSQWFSLWNRKGLPYLLHDTIPGQGWKGQNWSMALSWQIIRYKRWWTFTKQRFYTGFTDRRSILLDLAKQEQFPLEYIKENYWPGPFTYSQLPVISMTAKEMEFPHPSRPNLHYVGPMVFEKRVDPVIDKTSSYSLEDAFLYQKEKKASLIYCSVSTLHKGDQQFIHNLAAALKKHPEWVLIIGMGGLLKENFLGQLPENVFAFSYVPQLQVLSKADCSINHGGIHTINECIHFKVPMLVYSGKRSDQNGCAARVAYHRLGIMADKDKDGVKEIQLNIQEILHDEQYKNPIEALHKSYLNYKKDDSLKKIIEQYLS